MQGRTIGRAVSAVALGLSLFLSAASAEDAYPTHPVRMIAVSAPGGNPDVLARLLADRLSQMLGAPFIVEDVPGAGGVVGAKQEAAARPDGYMLSLIDTGALAINLAMHPDAGYHITDFTPITALASLPTVLVVKPSLPVKTLADFVAYAKSKPGKLSFGSAGAGSIHQMTMVIFAQQAGIDLLHVPYRGGTAMVNGLLTGEIDAGWSGIPNIISLVRTGKLRALCLSVPKRDPSMPEVPTCDELGYKGFNVATMLGLQGPAGLSPTIVAKVQAAVAKAMREPAMAKRMVSLGIQMQEDGTAQYAQFMKDDLARYSKVVNDLNLQASK